MLWKHAPGSLRGRFPGKMAFGARDISRHLMDVDLRSKIMFMPMGLSFYWGFITFGGGCSPILKKKKKQVFTHPGST